MVMGRVCLVGVKEYRGGFVPGRKVLSGSRLSCKSSSW